MNLEEMGFEIEASHHECAIGQHEIDFKYVDAMDGADKIMTLKLAVKTLAQKNGLHATFMPKPVYGVAGSGMHLNMSLFKDGRNVFYDEGGQRQLSKTVRSFIAGLLRHADGFTALTNPLAELAQQQLPKLRGCDAHFTVILSEVDENLLRRLGINVSCEARYETKKLYHK